MNALGVPSANNAVRLDAEEAAALGRHVGLVVNGHRRDEPIFDVAKTHGVRLA